jgi:hypothetical protein
MRLLMGSGWSLYVFAQFSGIESRPAFHHDRGMDGKAAVSTAKSTRQSIMAYLDGEHNLSWIVGVIEAAGDAEAAQHFLDELGGYGDPQRRESLRRRLVAEAA